MDYDDILMIQKEEIYRELYNELSDVRDGDLPDNHGSVWDGFEEYQRFRVEYEDAELKDRLDTYASLVDRMDELHDAFHNVDHELEATLPAAVYEDGLVQWRIGNDVETYDLGRFLWVNRGAFQEADDAVELRTALREDPAYIPVSRLDHYEEADARFWDHLVEGLGLGEGSEFDRLLTKQAMVEADIIETGQELYEELSGRIEQELFPGREALE